MPPTLYAFGSNGSGQLGIGHEEDVSVPTRCIFHEAEDNVPNLISGPGENGAGVARIVAGGNHTLVLCQDGAVYAAGWNEDGRCGGDNPKDEGGGKSLTGFRRVIVRDAETGVAYRVFKGVSATWEGSFLVAASGDEGGGGKVFAFGSGGKGELGLGSGRVRAVSGVRIPEFPPRGTSVVSIASGMGHTVVVLSNGEVYGWGAARKGQLGEGAVGEKIVWSPVRIDGVPFYVKGVACGREFTVLSGDHEAGEFVVLGASGNKWGVLSDVPAAEAVKGYLGIDASWHGVYVHRGDLAIHAWGRNDRGQLPPSDLGKAKTLAVGSEHALALLENGTVVAFGWGEHGNCGPDTDAQGNVKGTCSRIPLPEEDIEVVGLGAGCATSWIIAY